MHFNGKIHLLVGKPKNGNENNTKISLSIGCEKGLQAHSLEKQSSPSAWHAEQTG